MNIVSKVDSNTVSVSTPVNYSYDVLVANRDSLLRSLEAQERNLKETQAQLDEANALLAKADALGVVPTDTVEVTSLAQEDRLN